MLEIDNLVAYVAERYDPDQRDGRRLLHGRGHTIVGLEQVTVDHFPPYLIVGLYRDAAHEGQDVVRSLAEALAEACCGVEGVAVQRRDGRRTVSEVVFGDVPERMLVSENGLKFWVQPLANQNVGLFLDMAPLRKRLASSCEGQRVLNLFAYTCSLSVAALAGGAERVVSNDMSRPAIAVGEENHQANAQDLRAVRMVPHNLFKSWWKIRQLGPYDVVVIDPPTNQRGSFVAEKNYGQVLKRLPEFCNPGARVFACLNSPFHNVDFLPGLVARWCPQLSLVERMKNSPDFPDVDEDRALKVFEYRFSG